MVIAANTSQATSVADLMADLASAKSALDASRPTAVNLEWATGHLLRFAENLQSEPSITPEQIAAGLLQCAQQLADDDVDVNRRMSKHGAEVVPEGANILHHW